jgi:hypothetical protein
MSQSSNNPRERQAHAREMRQIAQAMSQDELEGIAQLWLAGTAAA